MIVEIFYTVASAVLFSIPLGYFLSRSPRIRRLLNKEEKKLYEIASNPELVLEKIKENGEIIDNGDILTITLDYSNVPQDLPGNNIKGFKRFFIPKQVIQKPVFNIVRKPYKKTPLFSTVRAASKVKKVKKNKKKKPVKSKSIKSH